MTDSNTRLTHFALLFFSLAFMVIGIYLFVVEHDSTWGLAAATFLSVLSPCLAIPAQIGPALHLLVSVAPTSFTGKQNSNAS